MFCLETKKDKLTPVTKKDTCIVRNSDKQKLALLCLINGGTEMHVKVEVAQMHRVVLFSGPDFKDADMYEVNFVKQDFRLWDITENRKYTFRWVQEEKKEDEITLGP